MAFALQVWWPERKLWDTERRGASLSGMQFMFERTVLREQDSHNDRPVRLVDEDTGAVMAAYPAPANAETPPADVFVLRCWGIAGLPAADGLAGMFLEAADVEAFGGRGDATWTPAATNAMRFPSAAEAMAYWQSQSVTVPLRPDGKPNRPLTAFHVEVVSLRLALAGAP